MTVKLNGNLADLTPAKAQSYKNALAAKLGIDPSRLIVKFKSGSIVIEVEIPEVVTADALDGLSSSMEAGSFNPLPDFPLESVQVATAPVSAAESDLPQQCGGLQVRPS